MSNKPPILEDVSVDKIAEFETRYLKYKNSLDSANSGKLWALKKDILSRRDCISASLLEAIEELFEEQGQGYYELAIEMKNASIDEYLKERLGKADFKSTRVGLQKRLG